MKLTKYIKVSIVGLTTLVLGVMFFSFYSWQKVHANPSYFAPSVVLGGAGTATTSPYWMTAGKATSTSLILDSFYTNTLGNYTKTDSARLALQMGASSTASVLSIRVEYAWDQAGVNCQSTPLACDWFPSSVFNSTTATSTYSSSLAEILQPFASSTVGGIAVAANNATTTYQYPIATPFRYTRIVFSVPVGSTGVNIWAVLVPVKEKSE